MQNVPCPEDGVVFDPETIQIDTIRGQHIYGGFRVRIRGSLGQARLSLQVDIGFGDVITPRREEQDYPTLLDQPVPRLWMYPRETLVAEKLEAMVQLGVANSRVKDLWDVAYLARRFAFDGETLRTAIAGTFGRRRTAFGRERPEALLPGFYEGTTRARRWTDLRRQVGAGSRWSGQPRGRRRGTAPLPRAGLRQLDRGTAVHAGLARRRALAARDFRLERRANKP